MEQWIWITIWFLFCVRYSRLHWVYHKKHEIFTANPSKIKDRYMLELQTPETMKLFGSTKKLKVKTKNGENVPSLEVVEVVLVQFYLLDNQY